MAKVSAVLSVVSEEVSILARLLASIEVLADEIVVVDMTNGADLSHLVRKFGLKIYPHERAPYVEAIRNFGISKAKNDWILILDPDEEVGTALSSSLRKILDKPKADYYRIPRKNIIFGHWMRHSRWWPDYNIRLFRKGFVSWNEIIHAVPITQGKSVEIEAKENLAIIHHHYDSIEQYLERMNRYTSAQAIVRINEGYKFTWRDLIEKPVREFLSRYFFGEGYKDGIHGLALASLQAFSELILYLKIWQKEKFKESEVKLKDIINLMRDEEKEVHFWQSDASYRESGRLTDRIRRKFRI